MHNHTDNPFFFIKVVHILYVSFNSIPNVFIVGIRKENRFESTIIRGKEIRKDFFLYALDYTLYSNEFESELESINGLTVNFSTNQNSVFIFYGKRKKSFRSVQSDNDNLFFMDMTFGNVLTE